MRWSPSRVTSARFPSGKTATPLGPDLASPSWTLPLAGTVLPLTVRIETVPSPRFVTSASLPSGLNDTPAGELPSSRVAMTAGGDALRSMTLSLLSGAVFLGSVGSILVDAAISAMLSSGATATLCGGPTTDPGAFSWPTNLGGDTPRSMIVTLSGGGFSTILFTPSTLIILVSFDDTASCALVYVGRAISTSRARATLSVMLFPPRSEARPAKV